MREYDDMHKLMEYRKIHDFYEAWRHIQSAMEGDTPVKTGQHRQCIDNLSDYDREHDRILNSVCHRLDLGPTMLPGAQQHTTVESAAALKIQDNVMTDNISRPTHFPKDKTEHKVDSLNIYCENTLPQQGIHEELFSFTINSIPQNQVICTT